MAPLDKLFECFEGVDFEPDCNCTFGMRQLQRRQQRPQLAAAVVVVVVVKQLLVVLVRQPTRLLVGVVAAWPRR